MMMLVLMLLARSLMCVWLAARARAEERTVRYRVREEMRTPALIGTLAGNVSGTLPGTRFKLMSPAGSFLRFRESDGRLTAEERVDRERLCKRSPECLLTFDVALVSSARFELIHVEVEVADVNDNSPEFPRARCSLEVPESAALGTRLALDAAEDADVGSNSVQSYRVTPDTHFGVDVSTRVDGVKYAELVLVKPLDREACARYELTLVAADGGQPARSGSVNVTVRVTDANDNSPVFEQSRYTLDVPEDTPPGSLLLVLRASDADEGLNGQVIYGLGKQVSASIRQLLGLDGRSGRLTLTGALDYEEESRYEVDALALDAGQNPVPSLCKIIINVRDVNDNPPEITVTSISALSEGVLMLSEAAAPDLLLALIAIKDRDGGASGQVGCTLSGGRGHFRLKRAYEGSYTIATAAALDRETLAQYNLTVAAEDFGVPPLRSYTHYLIRLVDVNDNPPLFSATSYEGFVEENQLPGTFITTIQATDTDAGLNGEISYELYDSDTNGVSRFAIMNQAGNVYALQSFNYEVTARLELRVLASDRGWPQLTGHALLVINIVDRNDHAPVITHPSVINGSAEVQLPRDAPPGYILTRVVARDSDAGLNAQLSYALLEGGALGFAVDVNVGDIYINQKISYDSGQVWTVVVMVSDHGDPSLTSTATIRILLTEATPSDHTFYDEERDEEPRRWTLVLILVLTSCSMLFFAVLSYILCRGRRSDRKRGGGELHQDVPLPEEHAAAVISSQTANVFEAHTYELEAAISSGETPRSLQSKHNSTPGEVDGYSTLPGYVKDAARPVTVWKGNSMMTIAVREPQISGKDSGKGDSDVNDSDSDISDGTKKDFSAVRAGLWACTSECRVLGHSDRCWSPSASRSRGALNPGHLSTFSRSHRTETPHRSPAQNPCDYIQLRATPSFSPT